VKESRFIELLNLYIDQQITPVEAAELEEDILANPRHRRTYQQYCRMHRACTLVFASAEGDAAGAAGPFEPVARRSAWKYYAGGLAAAACIGFVAVQVFVRPGRMAPRPDLAAVPAAPAPVRPAAVQPAAVRAASPWRMDAPAMAAVYRPSPPLTAVTISTVGVPDRIASDPLRPSIEDFVFEQAPAVPGSTSTFRNRPPNGRETEMTAFQFQR